MNIFSDDSSENKFRRKKKKKSKFVDSIGLLLIPATVGIIFLLLPFGKSFANFSYFERLHDSLGRQCPLDRPYLYMPSLLNCAFVGPSIYQVGCLSPAFCVPECINFQYSFRLGIPLTTNKILKTANTNHKFLVDRIIDFEFKYNLSKYAEEMVPHKGICSFKVIRDHKFKEFNPYWVHMRHVPMLITIDQKESAQAWFDRFKQVNEKHLFISKILLERNISLTLYLFIGCILSMFWMSMKIMRPVFMFNVEIFTSIFILIGLLAICLSNQQKAPYFNYESDLITNTIESNIQIQHTWSILGSVVVIVLALYCIVLITDNSTIKATMKLMPFTIGAVKAHRNAYIGLFFVMLIEIVIVAISARLIAYLLMDSDKAYSGHFVPEYLERPYLIQAHGESSHGVDFRSFKSYMIPQIWQSKCPNNIDATGFEKYKRCNFLNLSLTKRAKFFILVTYIVTLWILIVFENMIYLWTAKLFCHNYWHIKSLETVNLLKNFKTNYLIVNLGTVMIGSFFIFLTKPLFLFQFITPTNWITRRLFFKDINKTPFIWTAFDGTSYFKAMTESRYMSAVAVDKVVYSAKGIEISTLLSTFIVSTVTGIYCLLDLKSQVNIDAASYFAFLIIFIGVFRISQICLQVFEVALKSLLLCIYVDSNLNKGSPELPYNMPKKLIDMVSVPKFEEIK